MARFFIADLLFDQDGPGQQTLALLTNLASDDDQWVPGTALPSAPETFDLSSFSTISVRLDLIRGEHDHGALVKSHPLERDGR